MKTTNWPIITLGALCGCIIGRSLLPYIVACVNSEIAFALALMLNPLCILGCAFLALALTSRSADSAPGNASAGEPSADCGCVQDAQPEPPEGAAPPEAQPPSPGPTVFQRFIALYKPSCGMTVFQRVAHALAWAVILLVLNTICVAASQFCLRYLGCEVAPQPLAETVAANGLTLLPLVLFAISVCIPGPLAEELLFRRLLPETMTRFYMPELLAALISAILFAAVHELLWVLPGFFLFAMLLFHVAKKSDLLQCVLIHSLFNAGTMGMLLLLPLLLKNAA